MQRVKFTYQDKESALIKCPRKIIEDNASVTLYPRIALSEPPKLNQIQIEALDSENNVQDQLAQPLEVETSDFIALDLYNIVQEIINCVCMAAEDERLQSNQKEDITQDKDNLKHVKICLPNESPKKLFHRTHLLPISLPTRTKVTDHNLKAIQLLSNTIM